MLNYQINIETANWIKKHEGFMEYPVTSINGNMIIGYGRQIQSHGINHDEAEMMFQHDLARTLNDLDALPWTTSLPNNVYRALINICFNAGIIQLLQMTTFIDALKEGDYNRAARQLLNTTWATYWQTRAKDCAVMISEGQHASTRTDRPY